MKNFVCTQGKGFHITFSNGLTASVQWGKGNYCDNWFTEKANDVFCGAEANTAEVAVFDNKGNFIDANLFISPETESSCDTVVGYLTPKQVVEFLMNVKNFKL